MAYSVVLVGLGAIGMSYDISLPDRILSHAKAFHLHKEFDLVAGVDPSVETRRQFSKAYDVPAFATVSEIDGQPNPDLVVVAVPTETHLDVIGQILESCRPKAVLCEKPLAYTSAQARDISDKCKKLQVKLLVNYIRRADPGVLEVRARLHKKEISSPVKGVVWYSKGLLHNGSHFFDMMTFWLGPAKKLELIKPGRKMGTSDGEPDFRVEYEEGEVIFCSAREENFSYCTVELITGNGCLRYEHDGKISWRAVVPDSHLSGYLRLAPVPDTIKDDMARYQYHVAEQLTHCLAGQEHTLCSGELAARHISQLEPLLENSLN